MWSLLNVLVMTYRNSNIHTTTSHNAVLAVGGAITQVGIAREPNSIALNNGVITVGSPRSGVLLNNDNCGIVTIGGIANIISTNARYVSALSVGGVKINKTLSNSNDAWFHVGNDNGLDVMYDGSTDQSTMMMNGKTVNVQYSQTVTHEAPFTGNATDYSIGKPVFLSGKVCKWDCSKKEWSYQTSPMDCICEVKP